VAIALDHLISAEHLQLVERSRLMRRV